MGAPGLASVIVSTARQATGVSREEMAELAGCAADLVARIEEGSTDPALDTVARLANAVARLANAVGLELRAGWQDHQNPEYLAVSPEEVDRLAGELRAERERAAAVGIPERAPGPWPGTQPEWDGTDPAPARMIGAGFSRRPTGGWAALLLSGRRLEMGISRAETANATGLQLAEIDVLEEGIENHWFVRIQPAVGKLQEALEALGTRLHARLELYEHHGDTLHLQALADPLAYADRMRDWRRSAEQAAQSIQGAPRQGNPRQ